MVRNRALVGCLRIARRHRLRIEVIRIDKVRVLGIEMKGRIYNLPLRQDVIDLGEGVLAFMLRNVVRKRQCPVWTLIQKILERRNDEEPILDHRPAQHPVRCLVRDAAHVIAANAKIGKRIVQIEMPFVAAAPRFHRHHALRETSILR